MARNTLILLLHRVPPLSVFPAIIEPECDIEEDHEAEQGQLGKPEYPECPRCIGRQQLGREQRLTAGRHAGRVNSQGFTEPEDDAAKTHDKEYHPEYLERAECRLLGNKLRPFVLKTFSTVLFRR
jgi:hypothetical protein